MPISEVFTDSSFVGGKSYGEVANRIGDESYQLGLQRPFWLQKGVGHKRECVTINVGSKFNEEKGIIEPIEKTILRSQAESRGLITVNAATSLRKQEWQLLDLVVLKVARERLIAWNDLSAANTFGGFDGMSKSMLEWETMSDPGEAIIDMDGITEGRADSPTYQLEGLPLPITHCSFWYSDRNLRISRGTGTPLDVTSAESCARRVAESIEKQVIGIDVGLNYGVTADYGQVPKVYGYITHPQRNTKTDVTVPTGSNAAVTVGEVLEIIQTLAGDNMFGPFTVYHSTDWDEFMDDDYVAASPQNTLRERLVKISQISAVKRLDFLTNTFTLVFVQMTSNVARAVNGMEMTTVQWPEKGGAQQNFKVMTIKVPQIRADNSGQSGIMQATTA